MNDSIVELGLKMMDMWLVGVNSMSIKEGGNFDFVCRKVSGMKFSEVSERSSKRWEWKGKWGFLYKLCKRK